VIGEDETSDRLIAARNRSALGIAGSAVLATGASAAHNPPVQQRGRRLMKFFCGLDVAMDETAICVVDDKGTVHLQTTALSEPEAIWTALQPYLPRLRQVGHEAGSLSPWLHPELLKLGLPVVCLERQHARAALSAQRNKTDAVDALGLAHIMRTGWSARLISRAKAGTGYVCC
jgi:transposase